MPNDFNTSLKRSTLHLMASLPLLGMAFAFLMVTAALVPAVSAQGFGQGNGLGGQSPAYAPRPQAAAGPLRATGGLSKFATEEQVIAIRIKGNNTVPESRITAQMQTRVGRPFDPKMFARDIRKLSTLPYFISVRPFSESTEAGRIIILEVAERSAIRYIEFLGNESIKDKKLKQEVSLSVGGAIDPYAVEEGRRKLIALYKKNGYGRAVVIVEEGDQPNDRGVTYVITEGPRQRVWNVEFDGNTFATDAQLKTRIQTKNKFHHFWGGKIVDDELQADLKKLTDYYRAFGFFRARVGRVIDYSENGWATIRFVIDEGERYAVRNVSFFGIEAFEQETISGGLKQNGSAPFERALLNADLQWIKNVYGSKGYVFADIKAETVFLEEAGKVDVIYKVEEGEKFRVGRIFVSINGESSHTKVQTALNRIGIKPGEWIDTTKVGDAERRLGSSGLFNSNPTQGATPSITYKIQENKTRVATQPTSRSVGKPVYRGQSPQTQRPEAQRPATQPSEAQLPTASSVNKPVIPAYRHLVRKPVSTGWSSSQAGAGGVAANQTNSNYGPSVYQVRQGQGIAPSLQGQQYAETPAVARAYPTTTQTSTPVYGGQAVAPVSPSAAPAGYGNAPVQQLNSNGSTQVGYASQAYATTPASTYGQPAVQPIGQQQQVTQQPQAGQAVQPVQYTQAHGYSQPATGYNPSGPVAASIPSSPINTEIFPSATFAPASAATPGYPAADLYVNVNETQTGRFMVGVAVNSDAGLVGQITLDEKNFDWRRPPRSFQDFISGNAWRGGGQRFRLEAAPGSSVQRYVASWQEPYLMDTPISLSLSGNYYDRSFDNWDEQRLGGRVGFGYNWTDRDLSASVTYRGETVKVDDILLSNLGGVVPDYDAMNGNNELHGFGVKVVNDTRNNPFFATSGYYLSGTLEHVVGTFDYSRAEFEARKYFLLNERPDHTGRHVLIYQTRLGFTGSETPVYDRFYAGGFSTMRGFDFRGASPVAGVNQVEVGGDFRWLNTLEYLFPLSADGMINGVAFSDFGTVEESVKIDDFRVSVGCGLRLTVPAMGPAPIALDLAWPLAHADTDVKQVFTFNVGFMR